MTSVSDTERNRRGGDTAHHLHGKDNRSADDTSHGQPRPDEVSAGSPPGTQATHAGRPTNDPAPPHRESSNVGRDSVPMNDRDQTHRPRYTGHGRDTEGAFGEEEAPAEQP